jgi:integrase
VRRTLSRLSAAAIRHAKPGYKADGGNLYLQVTPGADGTMRKSWVFRYELDGRRHDMGLGPLHTLSLAEARDKARSLRQQLLEGIDPLEAKERARKERLAERAKEAKASTFKQCAEMYLEAHADGWKNAKHAAQWRSTLETYAYPVLGPLSVSDIDVGHVLKALEPIWRRIPETASRVRMRIESVLGYATARKFREGDNPARWRGHLATLLPAKGKIAKVAHHSALPYAELPAFMAELRKRDSLSARALELAILTAARTNEVIGLRWREIDFKTRTWTVPASRMKAKKQHVVPLSARALECLEAIPRHGDRVFPLSNMAMLELVRGMRPGITVHGFRSSFRTWASERTNFAREVCEQALAHTISDAVERAYRRGELLEKRRRLMAAWAEYCAKPAPRGETVVPLRAAADA